MREISQDENLPVIKLLEALQKIVTARSLDKEFERDEMEKYLSYLLQGRDPISPYERRSVGLDDGKWHELIKQALLHLNLRSNYEKLYKA